MQVVDTPQNQDKDQDQDVQVAACIARLQSVPAAPSFAHVPRKAQASVAALLFHARGDGDGEGDGTLRVLMTTRAQHLRSHPGQASLPGGKMDAVDANVAATALRESHEEIGLPPASATWLCTLPPLLSKTGMLVHPVVFYLPHGEKVLQRLLASPDEVDAIWSTRLDSFLASSPPAHIQLAHPNTVDTHRPPQTAFRTYTDIPWLGATYRLHRFRSPQQLIKGLTADALIQVASLAYGRAPAFQVHAPDQKSWAAMVHIIVQRLLDGQRGEKRWGDGESGDAQGSSQAYETHIGHDHDHDHDHKQQ